MATVTDDGNYTGMPLEEVEETLQMIQWNIKKTGQPISATFIIKNLIQLQKTVIKTVTWVQIK